MRRPPLFAALGTAWLCTSCGQTETPTSPTTVATGPRTIVFSGTLGVGGSRFYSFTTSQAGTASLMLASITRTSGGPALPATVGLGLGVPSGTDCAITASVATGAALTAQIAESVLPGIYCARIADVGGLSEPVAFAIRIVFP